MAWIYLPTAGALAPGGSIGRCGGADSVPPFGAAAFAACLEFVSA